MHLRTTTFSMVVLIPSFTQSRHFKPVGLPFLCGAQKIFDKCCGPNNDGPYTWSHTGLKQSEDGWMNEDVCSFLGEIHQRINLNLSSWLHYESVVWWLLVLKAICDAHSLVVGIYPQVLSLHYFKDNWLSDGKLVWWCFYLCKNWKRLILGFRNKYQFKWDHNSFFFFFFYATSGDWSFLLLFSILILTPSFLSSKTSSTYQTFSPKTCFSFQKREFCVTILGHQVPL